MSAFTIPSVFTAIDKFTKPVRAMQAASRGFGDNATAAVDRVNRKVNSLVPSLGQAGRQFMSFASTAALAGAIIAGVHFSFNALKDYEAALDSAQAITGTTNAEFAAFRKQIESVAKDAKVSGIEVAKAFEVAGSAKPELLANAEALGAVTKASIILSKASRDDLASSTKSLTGIMNQFNLGAEHSERSMNVLAAGSVVGSAGISEVSESMKNFGSVAAGANMSIEQSVALVEVMSTKQVKGAEAGTKLRASLLKLQQAGVGYASGQFNINDALNETVNKFNAIKTAKEKDAYLNKLFGAENISTGRILLSNIDLFKQFTKEVTGTTAAIDMAKQNSDNLTTALDELKAGWVNILISSESANGSLSIVKNTIQFVTDNLETIVKVLSYTVIGFLSLKVVLLAVKIAMTAWNIVVGIGAVIMKRNLIALKGNIVAMRAAAVATKLVAAAQWVWNAAMTANPIGLIIAGIAALIAIVTSVIAKYDEWGAAVALTMGPLGMIINLVQSFRRNWDMVKEAFTTEGMIEGLWAVGKVFLDAVLMPIQQLMKIIANFTGFEWADNAEKSIQKLREKMDLASNPELIAAAAKLSGGFEKVDLQGSRQNALRETITQERQNVSIDIRDQTGKASVQSDNNFAPVNVIPTFQFSQ